MDECSENKNHGHNLKMFYLYMANIFRIAQINLNYKIHTSGGKIIKALLLRIYLSENDRYQGKNAHHAVIEFLREQGIAGATVHHCTEGYGIHHKIHTASVLRLGTDLPVVVQAVDREERIRDLIPELKKMLPTELMVVQEVEVVSGEGFKEQ